MYPNEPTHTEELIQAIEENSPRITDILKAYIDEHDTTDMLEGIKYYYKENDITERIIYKYDNDGVKHPDYEATNNKLASGWHKLLVDQKTSYLVGDPVTIGSKTDQDIEVILDTLGDEFDDTLPELVTAASNKGVEWLHPYIDEEGNFDYIIIPAQEFIPIYDNTKRKNLINGIRVYELDDGTLKIELWDTEMVTFYEMVHGNIELDASIEVNPQSHWYKGENGFGWGKVPFVEFANNSKKVGDLTFYKDFIDAYDNLTSDTTNTLEDIQEIFYVLRGYSGTDMDQAVTNLKRYKGAAVDAEGGIETVKAEVPVDSIEKFLDRIVGDIYQFGQGVNTNTDKFGNSPSGIALKFLFSLLDMKANVLERKFAKGLRQFMWFVCEYLGETNQGNFDHKDITFTFNKAMLMNEAEQVDMLMKSPELSVRTKMENHPMVTDAQVEMARREEENEGMIDLDNEEVEEDE
ncbi:phage portal protein [Sediminibacillus massiliensis]|uniref:phage portal protein n=1 Tax=Sediminibacillus massiliensis TaxID=1926277 RepID=UPI00098872E0|nr:phage portal protein [Sediminibacillus massiliensis]